MKNIFKKKQIIYLSIGVAGLLALITATSYAFFASKLINNESSSLVRAGTIDLNVSDSVINPTKLFPIEDQDVETSDYAYKHTFTVSKSASSDFDVCYTVYLVIDSIGSGVANEDVKFKASNGSEEIVGNFNDISSGSEIPLFTYDSMPKSGSNQKTYNIYIWYSYDSTKQQSFSGNSSARQMTAHIKAVGNTGICPDGDTANYTAGTLAYKVLYDNPVRYNWSSLIEGNTSGNYSYTLINQKTLYTTNNTEDGSTVYLFAGNAQNNWVVFGEENLGANCVYNGQEVIDFQTVQQNGYNFTFEYATENTCNVTNVGTVEGVGYVTNIDQATFNAALSYYGFTGNYLTGENATWRKKTGFCMYNGFEVIDFASVNLNQQHFMYATADNCNLTNVGVVQGFGYVTNIDQATFNYVVAENGFTGEYLPGEYATFTQGGKKYLWRIIRTNTNIEGGGVRLLYSGSARLNQDGSIPSYRGYGLGGSFYNLSDNVISYAGYMWGTIGNINDSRTNQTVHSSTIAEKLNAWYKIDLSQYNSLINPYAIYCNDRSYSYGVQNNGYYYFGAYLRLNNGVYNPSLRCGTSADNPLNRMANYSIQDRFTALATNTLGQSVGNGDLVYPIALITADEIAFAGNGKAWYYYNPDNISIGDSGFWTMSPGYSEYENGLTYIYAVGFTNDLMGSLYLVNPLTDLGARPVISLKSDVSIVSGNGSRSNPYIINTN